MGGNICLLLEKKPILFNFKIPTMIGILDLWPERIPCLCELHEKVLCPVYHTTAHLRVK